MMEMRRKKTKLLILEILLCETHPHRVFVNFLIVLVEMVGEFISQVTDYIHTTHHQ